MNKYFKALSKKRLLFIGVFFLVSFYFLVLKSILYESQTSLIVRDLTTKSSAGGFDLSFLGSSASSQVQDSKVVEEYLLSLDMFMILDAEFKLTEHFKSSKLDIIERLRENSKTEDILKFYRKRIRVEYDEVSGILHIAYAHTDPQVAQNILSFLVKHVEHEFNEFNRKKAKKQLVFIEQEFEKTKEKMDVSSKKLEAYQNKNLLLDPSAEATSSSSIIASLESTLMQKQIQYATQKDYLNENSHELKALQNEINEISKSIEKEKKSLTGSGKDRLNRVLFEYEQLKIQLEFDIEVYKNALIQLETTKIEVLKEAKVLSVLSVPNLPDGYTYPNKPKVFITIFVVMMLVYGIFSMLIAIIRDHKE